MDIKQLAVKLMDWAERKGWNDQKIEEGVITFGDVCALLHSEVSEAYEDYRNGHGIRTIYYEKDGKPCGIPIELADLIIRILHNAERFDIDIEAAIDEKQAYNEIRPYRHGSKLS